LIALRPDVIVAQSPLSSPQCSEKHAKYRWYSLTYRSDRPRLYCEFSAARSQHHRHALVRGGYRWQMAGDA
jgi:hypothetical protein